MTAPTDLTPTSKPSSADARRHDRISCSRKLILLLPSSCTRIQAWSYNASRGGIGFYCLQPVSDRIVFLQTEEISGEAAEIEVVRCREVIDGLWECGAIVHRFVSDTDAVFACTSHIDA